MEKEDDAGFRIPFEFLFVVLMLGIGCQTAGAFFRSPYNTNDFAVANLKVLQVSDTGLVLTGYAGNYSGTSIRPVSLTVDAYDADGRIVGTGTAQMQSLPEIPPRTACRYMVEVPVPRGCGTVKNFVFIPRSFAGTGKLLNTSL